MLLSSFHRAKGGGGKWVKRVIVIVMLTDHENRGYLDRERSAPYSQ